MILTPEQLKLSKKKLQDLKNTLTSIGDDPEDFFQNIQIKSLEALITDIESEIKSYNKAESGEVEIKKSLSLDELKKQLILDRISKHIPYDELSKKSGVDSSQLLRIEASNYEYIDLSVLLNLSSSIGTDIEYVYETLDSDTQTVLYDYASPEEEVDEKIVPIKELIKREWVRAESAVEDLKEMFSNSGSLLNFAYHRKSTFNGKEAKSISLLAWESRVRILGEEALKENEVTYFEANPNWIPELVALSVHEDGPVRAQEYLLEKGIALVIEPHLKGTYLDGAALLSNLGFPIIGMTLRHDRLDNFWFVLFHELGHVFKHLYNNHGVSFVEENVMSTSGDTIEDEADTFALNSLIPPEKWKTCTSRAMPKKKVVESDAARNKVHPAIIAGRIRREKNKYTLLSTLVGNNLVRRMFGVSS